MDQATSGFSGRRDILSVSQLVHDVRVQLETGFHDIWVRGEISNLRSPSSGHLYFTLKDDSAQLKAVCFRMQSRYLRFRPDDGQEVLARGSLSVYPPRGDFQLVVELLEPVGTGVLQLGFEQLKKKLYAEGLFAEEFKKPLPSITKMVAIITSPSGAAVQDILKGLGKSCGIDILITPTTVQGPNAAPEIVRSLRYLNDREDIDLIILTRGGGSLEDLWCFNEETVARAIHESRIPVVSAVGHEVDYTISDFVADYRAATPTAAAELLVSNRASVQRQLAELQERARKAMLSILQTERGRLEQLSSRGSARSPQQYLRLSQQRLDELRHRLLGAVASQIKPAHWRLRENRRLLASFGQQIVQIKQSRLEAAIRHLQAVSPSAVLERGYAIVKADEKVIRNPEQLKVGQEFEVRVEKGDFKGRKIE